MREQVYGVAGWDSNRSATLAAVARKNLIYCVAVLGEGKWLSLRLCV